MKKYRDKTSGEKVVEVEDLSFLGDRNHRYSWFQRHYCHFRHKWALSGADRVIAADERVADDLVRYYFIPKEKITVKDQ